jgi:hypothetical protein
MNASDNYRAMIKQSGLFIYEKRTKKKKITIAHGMATTFYSEHSQFQFHAFLSVIIIPDSTV